MARCGPSSWSAYSVLTLVLSPPLSVTIPTYPVFFVYPEQESGPVDLLFVCKVQYHKWLISQVQTGEFNHAVSDGSDHRGGYAYGPWRSRGKPIGCFRARRDLKLITVALLKGSRYLLRTGISVVQIVDSVPFWPLNRENWPLWTLYSVFCILSFRFLDAKNNDCLFLHWQKKKVILKTMLVF